MSIDTQSEADPSGEEGRTEVDGRREFIKKIGKLAALTPPAITMLLATSMNSTAVIASGGGSRGSNNGVGYGVGGTPPRRMPPRR